MEYLVMECALGYAVVLDGEGRFIKVPNQGYEVGQVLDHVFLPEQERQEKQRFRRFSRWGALAACLCLVMLGGWRFWFSPIGEVRMQINPDMRIGVNRLDRVISLEGLNDDGQALIENYRAYGKTLQTVSDELADMAIEQGYLSDGGEITLTVTSDEDEWKVATEELLLLELDTHLDFRVSVVVVQAEGSEEETAAPQASQADTIIIEVDQIWQTDEQQDVAVTPAAPESTSSAASVPVEDDDDYDELPEGGDDRSELRDDESVDDAGGDTDDAPDDDDDDDGESVSEQSGDQEEPDDDPDQDDDSSDDDDSPALSEYISADDPVEDDDDTGDLDDGGDDDADDAWQDDTDED